MLDSSKPGFFDRLAERFGLDDFDKRHKKAFLIIALIAILIIVLWIMQLRKSIIYPLYGGVDPKVLQEQALARQQQAQATSPDDAKLKATDTDKDGLNDYDELNLYHTSPYLADTDSDGFSDKAEIDSGNDPNCPKGQNCFASSASSSQNNQALSSGSILENSLSAPTGTVTPQVTGTAKPSTGTLTEEEKNAIKQTLGDKINDPTTIRQLLSQLGMDQATLSALSDQQIIDTLNALLK
jgi:hypothetical protein